MYRLANQRLFMSLEIDAMNSFITTHSSVRKSTSHQNFSKWWKFWWYHGWIVQDGIY